MNEPQQNPAPITIPRPSLLVTMRAWLRDYFLGEDPTFGIAVVPMCFLSMLLFTRHPTKTNFIFDEQEALLANPYVRSIADHPPKLHWLDAFHRDFWGLPYDRSIGSYRPIPDLIWRALWGIGARDQTPFLHHWVNVLLHGVNGALMTVVVFKMTRRRGAAWLAGIFFVAAAIVTEAVSGVVGIADVLGGLGALLALSALTLDLVWMPIAIFLATLFGMYCKESALCIVPLVPFAAVVAAHTIHPRKPQRWLRGALALLATAAAFVLYVEARRRMFPAPISNDLSDDAIASKHGLAKIFAKLLKWYAQPALPRDAINNPLVDATPPYRIAGALRVYARGIGQVLFPRALSGDYSAPQEPIPDRLIFPASVVGAIALVVPIVTSLWIAIRSWLASRTREPDVGRAPIQDVRPIVSVSLMWIVISYFPVSNVPVILPTVRAERFWYFPVIGSSILLALLVSKLWARASTENMKRVIIGVVTAFVLMQCFFARKHANDYKDDLTFWDATRHAVPRSAKAHLNYSVMQGARGNLEERLLANREALALSPNWPMASIYLGDTLCRLHRPGEAWPYYEKGFNLAPNDKGLIALALQCLWDEHALDAESKTREQLASVAKEHPGSWIERLGDDILEEGDKYNGVNPVDRPRGYNEGPKE